MATLELDIIKQQAKMLLPKQKRELIEYLSKSLDAKTNGEISRPVRYGKYRNSGLKRSTAEVFKIAEWHPTETELNGD